MMDTSIESRPRGAALIKAVQDIRDGRVDLSLGETVQAATPFILPVAGASILAAIAITFGLILLTNNVSEMSRHVVDWMDKLGLDRLTVS